MQTAALLVRHSHRLPNKTIRISTQSTSNQVQNQQKCKNILLVLNDWNEWRTWNSLKRWAQVAPHAAYIRQWKSWSTACTFTGKTIWKYRATPFAEIIAEVVTMRMNNAYVRENSNLALVYQYFLLWRNNHNFFPTKTGLLYETIQLSTGQHFYSSYFKYFSCPFSTSH